MTGTEKQIAWASEIKERVAAILTEGIEVRKQTHPENTANLKGFTDMLNIVSSFDGYAGEMISTFKDVRRSGNIEKDVRKVLDTARATRVHTAECGEFGKALRALFGINY